MHKDLLYCLKYADNFPTDRKTALTFISCRMAQNARRAASTEEHYDAILKTHLAAHDVLHLTCPDFKVG